jgi:signal peptidase I
VPERLITHEDFGALAGEVLRKGGSFHFQAHGGSMRPFILDGETIELTAVKTDAIRRGEIILCWLAKDKLLLHRVIQVQKTPQGSSLLIQGDASCWPDGQIPLENVLGRAKAVFRKGKWISLNSIPYIYLSRLWLFSIPIRRLAARVAGKFIK